MSCRKRRVSRYVTLTPQQQLVFWPLQLHGIGDWSHWCKSNTWYLCYILFSFWIFLYASFCFFLEMLISDTISTICFLCYYGFVYTRVLVSIWYIFWVPSRCHCWQEYLVQGPKFTILPSKRYSNLVNCVYS